MANSALPASLPLSRKLRHTSSPVFLRNTLTRNGSLLLPHARVDINVLGADEERPVSRPDEPGVDLPHEVEEDEEGAGEVGLEEELGVEVGPTDGVEGDVELGDEAEDGDEEAEVGSPDTEGGAEGQLVDGVAVVFPITRLVNVHETKVSRRKMTYQALRNRIWARQTDP